MTYARLKWELMKVYFDVIILGLKIGWYQGKIEAGIDVGWSRFKLQLLAIEEFNLDSREDFLESELNRYERRNR